jgi:hypothetical protein
LTTFIKKHLWNGSLKIKINNASFCQIFVIISIIIECLSNVDEWIYRIKRTLVYTWIMIYFSILYALKFSLYAFFSIYRQCPSPKSRNYYLSFICVMVYNNFVVEYLRKTLETKLVSDEIFHMVMEITDRRFLKNNTSRFPKIWWLCPKILVLMNITGLYFNNFDSHLINR